MLDTMQGLLAMLDMPMVAINPMDSLVYEEETLADMAKFAKEHKMTYPYLHDPNQSIGAAYSVSYTPEAYVLRRQNNGWAVTYYGAIDNGTQPAVHSCLVEAAYNVAHSRRQPVRHRKSVGCVVNYRKK